ncbi:MAG: cation diffusion facilitator family transporter [Bacilli bacterium]|nr:cation diffusion facilitator family transporter [Bacilli bacterium]
MDPKVREKAIVRTSFIGIVGNIFLVGFKAFVGFVANSVSVIMDALNNLTDALSSLITLIGAKISNKKPDKKHPFGHGRVEYITSFIIAALILFAGALAIYQSIKSIIDYFQNGTMPDYSLVTIIIIAGAILVKAGIGIFYRIQGKKYDSDSLKASGMDALFDVILSFATLVGAVVAYVWNFYVEGYLGIVIGLFIIRTGIEVLAESISHIIGKRMDSEKIHEIMKDITSVEGVIGAYDLIINSYGHNRFIASVHIGVSEKLTAKEVQSIERKITAIMYMKHNTIMTVGIYAENNDDPFAKETKQYLVSLIKEYKTVMQMHGFYYDSEMKLINFDLVISFDDENPDSTINEIKGKMEEKYPGITFIVNYDKDFSLS